MSSSQEGIPTEGKFKIRYSEFESVVPRKSPRYSMKKQIESTLAISSQLEIKRKKSKNNKKVDISLSVSPHLQKQKEKSVSLQRKDSSHFQAPQPKSDRQYSKIPIQYYDERDRGNMAEKLRGRIVYRGYAPKNTYYYLKTIKQLKINTNIESISARGEDVAFNSKFESGNLHTAVRVSSREYWLFMREDTNTHGLRQWFYFEARARKDMRVKLRIYKYTKYFSLYKDGMKPFVKTDEHDWMQRGEKVVYELDKEQSCFYLQFEFDFKATQSTFFSTLPPYTYTKMCEYVQLLRTDPYITVQNSGLSLSGLDIFTLEIKDCQKSISKRNSKKQAVCVMARTHPSETNSNYALEGFISQVLDHEEILSVYDFYILPMVNPDGVFFGNHRTGILGQDLNRNFNSQLEYFPEVETVQKWIGKVREKQKITFLIDLHGHSAKKNIFAYGQEETIGSDRYLQSRILPKIISETIDIFRYDFCVFKASKEKQNTARVYFSKKLKINCVTFEESYGLIDAGPIGIANWKNFGIALVDSLFRYKQMTSVEDPFQEMHDYLQQDMELEKEKIRLRKEKLKKKFMAKVQKQRKKEMTETNQNYSFRNQTHQSKGDEIQSLLYSSCFNRQEEKYEFGDLIKRQLKTENEENIQKKSKNYHNGGVSQNAIGEANESQEDSSINSEQLSSGDEDKELAQEELQVLKKDIVRVHRQKEFAKRELYNLAEKRVELKSSWVNYEQRLHNEKSNLVPRILKLQMKRKEQFLEKQKTDNSAFGSSKTPRSMRDQKSFSSGNKQPNIELPQIKRH